MLFHPTVDFRSKTCCLTGHQDIAPWEERKVLNKMWIQVARLLQEGYLYFGVGGARGFDRLAAEYLLDIRDQWKKQIRMLYFLVQLIYGFLIDGVSVPVCFLAKV